MKAGRPGYPELNNEILRFVQDDGKRRAQDDGELLVKKYFYFSPIRYLSVPSLMLFNHQVPPASWDLHPWPISLWYATGPTRLMMT